MAIRSFYGTYDISIKLKGRQRLPKPKVENERMDLSVADVKLLVDHARSPRDRALILVGFQGGMDVSTLCSLKYLDVARGLELNDHPLKVDIFRKKRSVDYYTFLGRDAVEEIKAFQKDMRYYQKGSLVVTYHTSTGFLPGELEEFSNEVLAQRKRDLEKEAQKIVELLKQRKVAQ